MEAGATAPEFVFVGGESPLRGSLVNVGFHLGRLGEKVDGRVCDFASFFFLNCAVGFFLSGFRYKLDTCGVAFLSV